MKTLLFAVLLICACTLTVRPCGRIWTPQERARRLTEELSTLQVDRESIYVRMEDGRLDSQDAGCLLLMNDIAADAARQVWGKEDGEHMKKGKRPSKPKSKKPCNSGS